LWYQLTIGFTQRSFLVTAFNPLHTVIKYSLLKKHHMLFFTVEENNLGRYSYSAFIVNGPVTLPFRLFIITSSLPKLDVINHRGNVEVM